MLQLGNDPTGNKHRNIHHTPLAIAPCQGYKG